MISIHHSNCSFSVHRSV